MERRVEARPAVVAACVIGALAATVHGDAAAPRRGDATAYRLLNDARRWPPLDRGDAARTLAARRWAPVPSGAGEALPEPDGDRQIVEATCDADLVVVARVESSVPFPHPNRRWVLTAHELAVTRVLRTRTPKTARPARLRYVSPSGELTIGGRTVHTTVDRFPPIASDEEALFFLVDIGRSDGYRSSLVVPPMALRGGRLDGLGVPVADGVREPAAGLSALEAVKLPGAAVCRPAPIDHQWRSPSSDDGRLPPLAVPP